MRRCEAIKPTGQRCKSAAMSGGPWCYGHSPDRDDLDDLHEPVWVP